MNTVLQARPRNFVNTPIIERISCRALRYLQSGYSIHLKGAAGTGKTTLALHLADLLSRPIMFVVGDDEFKTSDLIGNQTGYTRRKVVDNFIHSVVKVEDELRHNWVDSRLTLACREGFTLVYDEFNRSRPEVNNVLLSALEEKLLVLPPSGQRSEYLRVSPHFRAIFTSNPEEYAGVHGTQDALLDRIITIHMPAPDELMQQQILVQKVGVDPAAALLIVRLVDAFHSKTASNGACSLRPCLMIASICHDHGVPVMTEDADFRDICSDVLLSRISDQLSTATHTLWDLFNELTVSQTVTLTRSERSSESTAPVASSESVEANTTSSGTETTAPTEAESATVESQIATVESQIATSEAHEGTEMSILTYLSAKESASLPEIETALSLTRFKAVDALRSLIDAGHLEKRNDSGKPTVYCLSAN